jgi:hypothetical protein
MGLITHDVMGLLLVSPTGDVADLDMRQKAGKK